MALSNWDCIAWDERGEPCDGRLRTPDGIIVDIYKNWVYVYDKTAYESWKSDCKNYDHPCIMEIHEGIFTYKNIDIRATRGKQGAIYVAAIYRIYRENKVLGLYGIGCYGYESDEWVGVKEETIADFFRWLYKTAEKYILPIPETFGEQKRFNQGDRLFADCFGFEIPTTEPEKADDPILSKLFKKLD